MCALIVTLTFVCMLPSLWIKVAVLRDRFDEAVQEYGYPLGLRADMAFGATYVGQRMLDERGQGAFINGPSNANQASCLKSSMLFNIE